MQVDGAGDSYITGNVGIGTTGPVQKLHVQGQCVTGDAILSILDERTISEVHGSLFMVHGIQIKDVEPGMKVLSLNHDTGEIEPHKIKALLDMGIKPVFKLTTEDGKSIRTTGNHPYLVKVQGDHEPTTMNKEPIAEGNYVLGLAREHGLGREDLSEDREFSEPRAVWLNTPSAGNTQEGVVHSSLLMVNGENVLDDGSCSGRGTKLLPGNLHRPVMPGKQSMSFSQSSLFNGGQIRKPNINESTMIQNIPTLILPLNCGKNPLMQPATLVSLNISNKAFETMSLRFLWNIGMRPLFLYPRVVYSSLGILSRALSDVSADAWADSVSCIPYNGPRTMINEPFAEGKYIGKGVTLRSSGLPEISSEATVSQGDRDQRLTDTESSNPQATTWAHQVVEAKWLKVIYLREGDEIAVYNEPRTMNNEPYVLWAKIASIEYVGYEQVYDIEVEGTHNFIANGIIAHNTYMSGNVGIGTTGPGDLLDAANAIDRGDLDTATGNTSGTLAGYGYINISMQDYCFFPNMYGTSGYIAVYAYVGSPGTDTTGRLSFVNGSSSSKPYAMYWRYVTASRDPEIFAWYDTENDLIVQIYQAEISSAEGLPLENDPAPPHWIPVQATIYDPDLSRLGEDNPTEYIMKNYRFKRYARASELSDSDPLKASPTKPETVFITHKDIYYGELEYVGEACAQKWEALYGEKDMGPLKQQAADIAEWYRSHDGQSLEAGDILTINQTTGFLQKSELENDAMLIGAVTTSPYLTISDKDYGDVSISLAGRVPIKVSDSNGPIKPGDPITSSEIPGIGVKATKPGQIIGRALAAFDPENGLGEIIESPEGVPEEVLCGKIMVFINVSWHDPDVARRELILDELVDELERQQKEIEGLKREMGLLRKEEKE